MRRRGLNTLTALTVAAVLSACASVSPHQTRSDLAALEGATPGMKAAVEASDEANLHAAQLADIRNAEARLDLARARLDYDSVRNRAADDGDVREFLDARRALRDARNVYGPTDTGRQEFSLWPFISYGQHWPRRDRNWLSEPDGEAEPLNPGAALPLSSLSR